MASSTLLQPYTHQVGGHSIDADGLPSALTDGNGRFLKRLQGGDRGDREAAFYAAAERARAAGGSDGAAPPGLAGLRALARWVPRSYGVVSVDPSQFCLSSEQQEQQEQQRYLVLEDVAAGYSRPCVLDAKLGLTTAYPWAPPELRAKYASKDAATTQAILGFRLCGVKTHRAGGGGDWQEDRHWGKRLTRAGAVAALARFADNGALSPADVLAPTLRELAGLRAALLAPGGVGFRLFSASALIVYEGAATRAEDARPRVVLVDFAHAFPTSDRGAAGGTGGENNDETNAPLAGPDANTAAGVEGLMAAIESALRGGST